jgi:hypothetical protein
MSIFKRGPRGQSVGDRTDRAPTKNNNFKRPAGRHVSLAIHVQNIPESGASERGFLSCRAAGRLWPKLFAVTFTKDVR